MDRQVPCPCLQRLTFPSRRHGSPLWFWLAARRCRKDSRRERCSKVPPQPVTCSSRSPSLTPPSPSARTQTVPRPKPAVQTHPVFVSLPLIPDRLRRASRIAIFALASACFRTVKKPLNSFTESFCAFDGITSSGVSGIRTAGQHLEGYQILGNCADRDFVSRFQNSYQLFGPFPAHRG